MQVKRFALLVCGLCLGNVFVPSVASSSAPDRLAERHFGRLHYSLLTDTPLESLTLLKATDWQHLPPELAAQLPLLEAGLAIQLGMPLYAQQLLVASDTQPLAHYWAGYVAFLHEQDEEGLRRYDMFIAQVSSLEEALEIGISEERWNDLHYLAASAAQRQGVVEHSAANRLSDQHIGQIYLGYNQALATFDPQQPLDAMLALKNVIAQMPSTQDNEAKALRHQLLLTLGQWQLQEGRISEAMNTFGLIDGPSLQRDEALLHFGWSLARKRDWPMAMGVWQALTQLGDSVFSLQAQHALALGYAEQGGDVQAAEQLNSLVERLTGALAELDQLEQALRQGDYWFDYVLQNEKSGLWPSRHADLLVQLLTERQAAAYEGLAQLYKVRQQLHDVDERHQALLALLQQREQRLAQRMQRSEWVALQAQESALQAQAEQLSTALNTTTSQLDANDNNAYVSALLSLATPAQRGSWQRLLQAKQRWYRVSASQSLSPDYAVRLARLEGALLWQMAEHAITAQWDVKKQWKNTRAVRDEAVQRLARVSQLTTLDNPIVAQQNAIAAQRELVVATQAQVESLVKQTEDLLTTDALTLMTGRREELQQQQYRARLAILQLKDRWRGADE